MTIRVPVPTTRREVLKRTAAVMALAGAWPIPERAGAAEIRTRDDMWRQPLKGDLLGETRLYATRYEDTLPSLARRYNLGYTEIATANPEVDSWLPGDKTPVVLPTGHLLPDGTREGILINLADQRLYYFPPGVTDAAESYAIGIGREGFATPLGETRVVRKQAKPTWYPPQSVRSRQPDLPRAVPPGPENPLGDFALYLSWPAYLIHGTHRPWGVGRRVSAGCIRLYPNGIERLFGQIDIDTPVMVVDRPAKIGWSGGELFMEVHPTQSQANEIETNRKLTSERDPDLAYRLIVAAGNQKDRIDWLRVQTAMKERRGIPVTAFKPG